MTVKDRLAYIEGLRGLAVGGVLVFHASIWAGVTGAVTKPLSWGGLGVDLFFVISGFCMAWPLLGNDGMLQPLGARSFYWRRFRRIWPPYAVAVLVTVGVSAAMWQIGNAGWWTQPMQSVFPTSAGTFTGNLASHLTLIHGFIPRYDRSIDGAFWSLSTEAQFYALLPLIVLTARRLGIGVTAAGMAAVSLAYVVMVHFVDPNFIVTFTGRDMVTFHLMEFGVGMLAAKLVHAGRSRVPGWSVVTLLVVTLAGAQGGPQAARPFVAALGFGSMVLWAARAPLANRILNWFPLRALGRVSYSAYLIHGATYMLVAILLTRLSLGAGARAAVFMVVGIPLAAGAATLLHRLIELPAIAWSHRRRTSVAALETQQAARPL